MPRSRLYRLFWDTVYCTGLTPWDTGDPPKQLQILVEDGDIEPCRAVDIGCGTGTSTIYLSKNRFEVVGVDISGEVINKAMMKAYEEDTRCRFVICDITDYAEIESYNLGRFELALDVERLYTIVLMTSEMSFLIGGLIFIGISFWNPSYNKTISIHTEKEYRATEYSKLNMFRAIASVPAPYIGGYLYDYIDIRLPFILSSIFFTATAITFYKLARNNQMRSI